VNGILATAKIKVQRFSRIAWDPPSADICLAEGRSAAKPFQNGNLESGSSL
jgi:hypothetical protein